MEKCSECRYELPRLRCLTCESKVCQSCHFNCHFPLPPNSFSLSLNEPRVDHLFLVLCEECDEEEGTQLCGECDETFCHGCFERIHKKGNRQAHKPTALGPKEEFVKYVDVFVLDPPVVCPTAVRALQRRVSEARRLDPHSIFLARAPVEGLEDAGEFFPIELPCLAERRAVLEQALMAFRARGWSVVSVFLFCDGEAPELAGLRIYPLPIIRDLRVCMGAEHRACGLLQGTRLDCSIEARSPELRRVRGRSESAAPPRVRPRASSLAPGPYQLVWPLPPQKSNELKIREMYESLKSCPRLKRASTEFPLWHEEPETPDPLARALWTEMVERAYSGLPTPPLASFLLEIQEKFLVSADVAEERLRLMAAESTINLKTRSFSQHHSLRFITFARPRNFSHEDFFWTLKSLEVDRISLTETMILARIKSLFNFDPSPQFYREYCRDFLRLDQAADFREKMFGGVQIFEHGSSYFFKISDCHYSVEDDIEFGEEDPDMRDFLQFIEQVFSLELFTDSQNRHSSDVLLQDINARRSNLSPSPRSPGSSLQYPEAFSTGDALNDPLPLAQSSSGVSEPPPPKMVPGGKYGFALLAKYFGPPEVQDLSLGKLISLTTSAIKLGAIKHHRTFLLKNDKFFSMKPQSSELLEEFKQSLVSLLKKNNGRFAMAQLKGHLEKATGKSFNTLAAFNINKIKQLAELMDGEVELKEEGTGNYFVCLRNMKQRNGKTKPSGRREGVVSCLHPAQPLNPIPSSHGKKNHSTLDGHFKRIKDYVLEILEEERGIELNLLEKKLKEHYRVSLDFPSLGYMSFCIFINKLLPDLIDIQAKVNMKQEIKLYIYLKSQAFNFRGRSKQALSTDKKEHSNFLSNLSKNNNSTINLSKLRNSMVMEDPALFIKELNTSTVDMNSQISLIGRQPEELSFSDVRELMEHWNGSVPKQKKSSLSRLNLLMEEHGRSESAKRNQFSENP